MAKSPDAFRTISEVAEWLGIQAHVLRFWESKFSQVKPVKRAGGRRYYRPADMALLGGIKKLLHDDGLTIKGVQKILKEQGVEHVSAGSPSIDDIPAEQPRRTPEVIRFQSRMTFAPDPGPAAEPHPEPPDAGDPATRDKAPDTPDTMDADLPDADQISAETVSEPGDEPAPDQASEPVPDRPPEQPALPSFLNRASEPMPPPTVTPVPDLPATPRPRVIDAPDPPAERDIRYVPGPLGVLAGIDRIDAKQAATLAPVARDLRAVLDRLTGQESA
jgi:DNA-binding transcriptional MerR regulator